MITSTAGVATADKSATVAKSTTSDASAANMGDRFLKLLVTQMKNQDPLNPMDNAQVTTQMAQISTVSGIEKLNQTLEAFTQAQTFQSVGMIGRSILAPGSFMNLASGAGVAGIDLPKSADSVKVSIFDSKGAQVREIDLGKEDAGVSVFAWDGKDANGNLMPDGAYTFRVAALASGKSVTPTNLAVGKVSSVMLNSTGSSLVVSGMGQVDMASVRQVL